MAAGVRPPCWQNTHAHAMLKPVSTGSDVTIRSLFCASFLRITSGWRHDDKKNSGVLFVNRWSLSISLRFRSVLDVRMTILPKKKHCDTKKSDANSSNEGRNRLRGSSSWSSSAGVRSPEEYSGDDSYRSTTFESREASDTGSSSKRRHRSPPHRLKYHERHSEETDYNSSDEYDPQKLDQPCTEEVCLQIELIILVREEWQIVGYIAFLVPLSDGGAIWTSSEGKERLCHQENGSRRCLFVSSSG